MSATKLKSFANLPKWSGITRLEAAENQLTGSNLAELQQYSDTLAVLKLANNKISNLDDLKTLTSFKSLKNLDLVENPVTKIEDYRNKIFRLLPQLEVLDGRNTDNQSVQSSEEDEYGEEGEFDQNGDFISDSDDDEGVANGKKFGSDDEDDEDDFFGEEGEDDFEEDDDSEEVQAPSTKRIKK